MMTITIRINFETIWWVSVVRKEQTPQEVNRYHWSAHDGTGVVKATGEVMHTFSDGASRLTAIVFDDLHECLQLQAKVRDSGNQESTSQEGAPSQVGGL